MDKKWIFSWIMILFIQEARPKSFDFKVKYQWTKIEFEFASEAERSEAITNGSFNLGKVEPIEAQYYYNDEKNSEQIFVTTPRILDNGIPATIGTVTDKKRDGDPVIRPWPSWSWHIDPEKCNYFRIVSVYRVWIDECDRMWIADSGVVGNSLVCPPQILAFDLKTDKFLYKYEIPKEQLANATLLVTVVVDVEDFENSCKNSWVYAADCDGRALIVYSLRQNTSWRIDDATFYPDPYYTVYNMSGTIFNVEDGILGMALSPRGDGEERKLYYHSLSSATENWVYTKDLKNRDNFKVPFGSSQLFHTYPKTRKEQSAAEATDQWGNLYFGLIISVEIVAWDPSENYELDNFRVVSNDSTLEFSSGVKISRNKEGIETLWIFSNAYQRWASGTLYENKTNFQVVYSEIY